MGRFLLYEGVDAWRAEVAEVQLGPTSLTAAGTQLGRDPLPYRLDWELVTDLGFVTRLLTARAAGDGWSRRLELARDEAGRWSITAEADGPVELPEPGGEPAALEGALDCDLGRCPITNAMPVLRHALHERPGAVDFLMAWVSVPDLGVHPAPQRYEHLARGRVRYVGSHRSFVGELELDGDGLVIVYPELARRIQDQPG